MIGPTHGSLGSSSVIDPTHRSLGYSSVMGPTQVIMHYPQETNDPLRLCGG